MSAASRLAAFTKAVRTLLSLPRLAPGSSPRICYQVSLNMTNLEPLNRLQALDLPLPWCENSSVLAGCSNASSHVSCPHQRRCPLSRHFLLARRALITMLMRVS